MWDICPGCYRLFEKKQGFLSKFNELYCCEKCSVKMESIAK